MMLAAFLRGAPPDVGWRAPASRLAGPALVLGLVATSGVMGLVERRQATTWLDSTV